MLIMNKMHLVMLHHPTVHSRNGQLLLNHVIERLLN